jgi:hypothetical protein
MKVYPQIRIQLPPITELKKMSKGQKKPQGRRVISKPCLYCETLTPDRYEVAWGWSRSDDTNEHICPACKAKEFGGRSV